MNIRKITYSFTLVASVVATACSSTDGGSSGTSGGGNCACDVSVNGVAKTITCGTNACVGGDTYACSATAEISNTAGCTSPEADAGSKGDAGPITSDTFDCTDPFNTYKCKTATEYCIVTAVKRVAGYDKNATCVPKPAGCNACDCAQADAPTAASNPKKFCSGGVTVSCASSNGEIRVSCQN